MANPEKKVKFSRDQCLESIARSLGRWADAHERLVVTFERHVELGEKVVEMQLKEAEEDARDAENELRDMLNDKTPEPPGSNVVLEADVLPIEANGGE